jgi:hypothetical protein
MPAGRFSPRVDERRARLIRLDRIARREPRAVLGVLEFWLAPTHRGAVRGAS